MALTPLVKGFSSTTRPVRLHADDLRDAVAILDGYVRADPERLGPVKFKTTSHEADSLDDILNMSQKSLESLEITAGPYERVRLDIGPFRATVFGWSGDAEAAATASRLWDLVQSRELGKWAAREALLHLKAMLGLGLAVALGSFSVGKIVGHYYASNDAALLAQIGAALVGWVIVGVLASKGYKVEDPVILRHGAGGWERYATPLNLLLAAMAAVVPLVLWLIDRSEK